MVRVTVSEAQENLSEIIAGLLPGEEVEIFQDGCLVARLFGEPKKSFADNHLNLEYNPESPQREVVRLVRFRFTGEMEPIPYDFDDEEDE